MLDKNLIKKKDYINKILNTKSNNDFDIINILRKKCDRIDIVKGKAILDIETTKFEIDIKKKKVDKIVAFDKSLNKFKEFIF